HVRRISPASWISPQLDDDLARLHPPEVSASHLLDGPHVRAQGFGLAHEPFVLGPQTRIALLSNGQLPPQLQIARESRLGVNVIWPVAERRGQRHRRQYAQDPGISNAASATHGGLGCSVSGWHARTAIFLLTQRGISQIRVHTKQNGAMPAR